MENIIAKVLNLVKIYQSDIVLGISIMLITVISFNLGKIAAFESIKTPITIHQPPDTALAQAEATISKKPMSTTQKPRVDRHAAQKLSEPVVASKSGKSKLFHYSWCSGYTKITERNRITFPNTAAAIAAGYTLAGNCK